MVETSHIESLDMKNGDSGKSWLFTYHRLRGQLVWSVQFAWLFLFLSNISSHESIYKISEECSDNLKKGLISRRPGIGDMISAILEDYEKDNWFAWGSQVHRYNIENNVNQWVLFTQIAENTSKVKTHSISKNVIIDGKNNVFVLLH